MNDCIEWPGSRDRDGYGVTRNRRAHRIAYERAFGPIPSGLVVRHRCDNPPCVNPDHLEVGTVADNNRDRTLRGRDAKGSQTHCVHGHEFVAGNTYIKSNGCRMCRACHRDRERARYAKKAGS